MGSFSVPFYILESSPSSGHQTVKFILACRCLQPIAFINSGKSQFHAIEIMACPGGCIDGGGQPLHHGNSDIIKARWEDTSP